MIKIAFGPKISSLFNSTNPNMIFHIGKKNTVVFKPTPRAAISTTKQGKGYFFTDKIEHGPHGVTVILDGNSAQAFRNCFAHLNNLFVQSGSEGRGNCDIVPGDKIFTQLIEPCQIVHNSPDDQEAPKIRKKREVTQVVDVDTNNDNLAHCSLLYGTAWINNSRLGFCGYHNVFVLVQKTTKKTQYIAFHPNHFAVFELDPLDLSGNRFKEQSFNAAAFYEKILQRYHHVQSGSEIIQTILKLLKLRTQEQYSLQTEQLQTTEMRVEVNAEQTLEETS